jgi:hypothetical protein
MCTVVRVSTAQITIQWVMLLQMLKCMIHLVSKSVIFNTTVFYYPTISKTSLVQRKTLQIYYIFNTEGRPWILLTLWTHYLLLIHMQVTLPLTGTYKKQQENTRKSLAIITLLICDNNRLHDKWVVVLFYTFSPFFLEWNPIKFWTSAYIMINGI